MAMAEQTAADTLAMLEERLARVTFAVYGDAHEGAKTDSPASAGTRLRNLERHLKSLAAASYTVSDILQLQQRNPELFHPVDSSAPPKTIPPASLVQLVLAHDDLYRKSASQLSALSDNKDVPDPAALLKLIALQFRIEKFEAKQKQQAKEVAELRTRSARLVENWYENGVLDMGDKWADWEERLKDVEILVRRREAAKRREEGAI